MNPNLPCGVTDAMVDQQFGRTEYDEFEETYLNYHWDDVEMFNAWFNDLEGNIPAGSGKSVLTTTGVFALVNYFDSVEREWEQHLKEEASKDYWEGRIEQE